MRIKRLFSNTVSINAPADFPTDLSEYDVVYIGYGDSYRLQNKAGQLIEAVRNGVGLIVSQPNVVGEVGLFPPGFNATVTDFAWPGWPNHPSPDSEFTPAGAAHPILQGLATADLCDMLDTIPISQLGPGWRVLAKAVGYPDLVLAAGSYGSGHLVIHTGNIADVAGCGRSGPASDAFVRQMLTWAGTPGSPSDPDIPQQGDTFVVNTLDDLDDGMCGVNHCSLREAIAAANAHANGSQRDRIRFELLDITGSPVVHVQSALPEITEAVSIDGATPQGLVTLDGSAARGDGLVFRSSGSLLRGLVIHSFSGAGVSLEGDGNVLEGNDIGTTGFDDKGNGVAGVYITGNNNRIGGENAGSGNLISGNGNRLPSLGAGIYIIHGTGNRILGNFIGVDAFGRSALPNRRGIYLLSADDTVVGGEHSGARNLISGNTGPGIEVSDGENVTIVGNVIGLDLQTQQPLANEVGIFLDSLDDSVIRHNILAGNRGAGIQLRFSKENEIEDNLIGVTLTGTRVGNDGPGVQLQSARDNVLTANRIAFNQAAGILLDGALDEGLLQNAIYANATGIQFINSNNNETPPPVITQVTQDEVRGTAPANSEVQIFGDDGGQGRYYLGKTTADGDGNFTFRGELRGRNITAIATAFPGFHPYSSSAFSAPFTRPSPCADPYESNDDWLQAWEVSAGDVLQGFICEPGDIDFYKLPASAVGLGGRVNFHLETGGADLDLVLFRPTFISYDLPITDIPPAQAPSADVPVESLPLQNIPLQNIPLQNIPLQNIPLQNIPLQNIPLQNIPLQNIPLQNIPLQNIPLQNIPLQNIPLQNIPLQNIPIVAYSANPTGQDEEVSDRMIFTSDAYYLMVIGHNGAYGSQPYTLTVQVEPPPPPQPCTFDPPFSGNPGHAFQPYADENIQTLILIPQQRLESLYGAEAVASLITALHTFSRQPTIKGLVLPVETDPYVAQAYDDWDEHFCDPLRANAVAGRIKGLIYQSAQQLPNLHTVILIGDDAVLPFRRLPDLTETANEREYAPQSLLKTDTALYAALRQGYMLSDDFYVDFYPTLYGGWPLYAPDLAIGRLVETPAEITAQLDVFKQRQGKLSAEKATVFGYDFLKDSSQQMADTLAQQGFQPQVLNNDEWDADALRGILLQNRHDFNALNAHFTHFLMAPAASIFGQQGELFRASEIVSATVEMTGSINASMGCHSGLNVCDECVNQQGRNMGADLDFAQAFARKQALWLGNSGFGYGDDAAVALSEELVSAFVRYLGSQADMPVGEALRRAKKDYALLNMGAYGPYDRKALNELTLYGIPNYQVTVPHPQPVGNEDRVNAGPVQQVGYSQHLKTRQFTLSPALTRVTTPSGDYYQAEDGIQPLLYNPVQPRSQFDIALDASTYPGFTARGVLFLGGRFQDIPNFDPVITMPVTDTHRYEPQIIYHDWQPLNPARLNHFVSDEGTREWLTVTPGQFHHQRVDNRDPQHLRVVGVERIYQQMQFQAYYSDAADFTPPIINRVQATRQNRNLSFAVQVSDAGGMLRVVVVCSGDNGRWQSVDLSVAAGTSGRWQGTLPNAGQDAFCLVQAVDNAGNVALTDAKGQLYLPEMPYRYYLSWVEDSR